ncbi:PREDICTED: uncharacterized protein LOC105366232 [Ceratosolen solmsi marchali]|uniref:Uncharacterized protein LOC105366232 n=1 Tax=Ceratosolen solmsi marchali TaxID=326594 RepID=A0AAJ6YRJ4_9HYME|nr:PREDICTED: uncharacterized protein LOC105366232 [Ceratosolen solmsi marchali]
MRTQVKQQKVPTNAVGVPVSGRLRKCRRGKRLFRVQALKMLSQKHSEPASGSESSDCKSSSDGAAAGGSGAGGVAVTLTCYDNTQEFLSTGRTGRRNAIPDIHGRHADTDTADLPQRLEALTTDSTEANGTRSQPEAEPTQQNVG